jgi:hypothetical protein
VDLAGPFPVVEAVISQRQQNVMRIPRQTERRRHLTNAFSIFPVTTRATGIATPRLIWPHDGLYCSITDFIFPDQSENPQARIKQFT